MLQLPDEQHADAADGLAGPRHVRRLPALRPHHRRPGHHQHCSVLSLCLYNSYLSEEHAKISVTNPSKRDVAKPMSLQNTLSLHIPVSFELGCGWLCMTIILRKKIYI